MFLLVLIYTYIYIDLFHQGCSVTLYDLWWTDLLNELDTGSQVHPKVDELPFDAFLLVFLLLQDKHVMIEKLLQFFISKVDTQLLQAVELQLKKKKKHFKQNCYLCLLFSKT